MCCHEYWRHHCKGYHALVFRIFCGLPSFLTDSWLFLSYLSTLNMTQTPTRNSNFTKLSHFNSDWQVPCIYNSDWVTFAKSKSNTFKGAFMYLSFWIKFDKGLYRRNYRKNIMLLCVGFFSEIKRRLFVGTCIFRLSVQTMITILFTHFFSVVIVVVLLHGPVAL